MDECDLPLQKIVVSINGKSQMEFTECLDGFTYACRPEKSLDQFTFKIILSDGRVWHLGVMFSSQGDGEPFIISKPIMQ